MTGTFFSYRNKLRWPWWYLLIAAPGCTFCSHGPLLSIPMQPMVIDRSCPQTMGALSPGYSVAAPMPAPTPQQGQSIRSEVAQPDGVLPPELPGSIQVPRLTPGEPLPHAEPGPAIETPPAPARPTLSVPNRPGKRRILALEVRP